MYKFFLDFFKILLIHIYEETMYTKIRSQLTDRRLRAACRRPTGPCGCGAGIAACSESQSAGRS
jgi:hypothetical protein